MLAPVTHILPLTKIRRARLLPRPGKVLVRPGQKVAATDVIAQALVPSTHILLDIRRGLAIQKSSEVERHIVRQTGDLLEKGDVIAQTSGLFSRIIRAPQKGEIVNISNGQVLLQTDTSTIDILAGINATVTEITPDLGAILEIDGALIQGVWGNGQMDGGLLRVLASAPEDEITSQQIDVSMRGAVIMGGYCSTADTLQAGADLPLRGLILSSIAADLIPVAEKMPYPIVVIEGFGKIPLNSIAYKILTTSDKRDISLYGAYQQRGERPEIIIPLPATGGAAIDTCYFETGQAVRIQGLPYRGKIGTIVQLKKGISTLANGIKTSAAEVQLEDASRVTVPLANLEVIV